MNGSNRNDKTGRKEVAIFGGGIAGLTAAHELIERGFRVELFEPFLPSVADKLDQLSDPVCALGGVTRTQWSRAERPDAHSAPSRMVRTQHIFSLPEGLRHINFDHGQADLTDAAKATLDRLGCFLRDPEHFKMGSCEEPAEFSEDVEIKIAHVEVQGFTDDRTATPHPEGKLEERVDYERAKAAADYLEKQCPKVEFHPMAMGFGHSDDWRKLPCERNYVRFHILENWIPGEHGFRFFPSFYQNLFNTMRRTPIAEERGVYMESPRTVLDNLVPTKVQRIAFNEADKTFDFPRCPPGSLHDLFERLGEAMKALGMTPKDLAWFELKLFKYMTSCPKRREEEYEDISWWTFLEAERFSPRFQKYLDAAGQLLVSMTAKESDARSYGNCSVQLHLDQFLGRSRVDGTLNAPTSLAWFDHWRRYLERQGVEFHCGRLAELKVFEYEGGKQTVWPVVQLLKKESRDPEGKPQVLVRDYYVLAIGESNLQARLNETEELQTPDFQRIRAMDLGKPTEPHPKGCHAHMSGIQYYFESDVQFLEGHTVYVDSEWALSSISQPQFWVQKRGWWSGYRGILSVDICNWFKESSHTRKSAWNSTRQQIAEEVWRQIKATLKKDQSVPEPILYHLDTFIRFNGANGTVSENMTPYLITKVGEYRRRPGIPDHYEVYYESIVLAGNYMQTYTRMTTMEAANESARHAVNAILKHSDFKGDRCIRWNPEECEHPDLRYLVELDYKLWKARLPHMVDILDLREVPHALLRPDPDLSAVGLNVRQVKGAPD